MPIASKKLPPCEYLHECLASVPGDLIRKSRPLSHFASTRIGHTINTRDAGKSAGSLGLNGHVSVTLGGVKYLRSRIIWKMVYGVDPPDEVDHIDGDPSNDRLENLRLATSTENKRNRKTKGGAGSGLKGVYRCGDRWRASVCADRVQYHLGTFDTPEEAHAAYCEAARRLHGAFAREG